MRIWLILFPLLTWGEYRAFELVITDSETGEERTVISTLDPNQYRGYHPVKSTETVTYRATWRCRGNTSYKPICPQPEEVSPQSSPPPSLDQETPK